MQMEIQIKGNKIFAPLKDKWLVNKPEEEVRQKYICRLVNNYEYSLEQMSQDMQVTNSQRGKGAARADIVIWRNATEKNEKKHPLIVVECKAESVTIRKEDYYRGMNYAFCDHADFFVTTNSKETRIFKIVKGEIPDKLEEVVDIPDAKKANDKKEIDKLLGQTKAFARDEFSRLLFKCHNIIRNNDKLSPEAAFDEISKILFIKRNYERNKSNAQIFSLAEFNQLKKESDAKPNEFYQELFNDTKKAFEKDSLFSDNAKIEIRENSFEQIIKELEVYNLSSIDDDVKGIAFEKFLGKTFRGELGQFFTPRTVVDFMVSVLDPQEGECVCDPCCGSGGFLIKSFEHVREYIEESIKIQKDEIKNKYYDEKFENLSENRKQEIETKVDRLFAELNKEFDVGNEKGRLHTLSFDCIYGTDANPRMARTAKMNMIMHGDGHGGVHHHDGLLNVNGIFENRFDVILTNPPFGARVEKDLKILEADKFTDKVKIAEYTKRYGDAYIEALKQVNDNIGKPLLSLYKIDNGLTEVLFIERCLNLLKPGGRMGIVLPEGVLNNSNLQKVREFVESRAKILLIVSIPQDVFMASGATVKPSLLFFKKFTEKEAEEFKKIKNDATKEIEAKYFDELSAIESQLEKCGKEAVSKDNKKKLNARKKKIDEDKASEIRRIVKEKFDYEISIAEIKKAGISSIGAPIDNELKPLAEEYTPYRKEKNLWNAPEKIIKYDLIENDKIYRVRVVNGKVAEPEAFYGQNV